MDRRASDIGADTPSNQAQYHRLQSSPSSRHTEPNADPSSVAAPAAGPSDLPQERPNSELFRTLTSSQLLNFRQRLLDDDVSDAPTRADLLTRQRTASSPAPAANQGYLRMLYRSLPRSLRFRQNTRSTTRYIDPANAASLRSRVRARKKEEQARNEGLADQGSPVPESRDMTDFEREMATSRAGHRPHRRF
ncbi:hypothetical protein PInf_022946 [Phytophthora infestans]|nr:hypothetical protein PInf_022946 [Phytophthora infestans]